jgi:UDP:flavonoid glycosyltransferase YjiC (YdhE family)
VAVAAPLDLAERVAKTGAAFFPFSHPGDSGLQPLWVRMHEAPQEERNAFVVKEIFATACAAAALPKLLTIMQTWKPSMVVRESQEYAAILATEKLGIPRARVSIMQRAFERAAIEIAAASVDAHRGALGLSSDQTGKRILAEPSLSLFPQSFDPPDADQAHVARFRVVSAPALPLPNWWSNLDHPLVYVTLGTVTGGMAPLRDAYRCVLDAVSTMPIRVLLTIGAELPMEDLKEIPSNVHVERFVPQNEVLPHAAAVVCHGGSGTIIGALAAGVPMVIAPMFADQPENAARVNNVGVGIGLPTAGRNPEELRHALTRVLKEPAFRKIAQQMAAEIASLPTVSEAALEIEQMAETVLGDPKPNDVSV